MNSEAQVLKRALEREKKARLKAEKLLEDKTRELYYSTRQTQKQAAYLSNTLKSIRDAVFITNRSGMINDTNNAAAEMLHCDRDSLMGRPLSDFFDAEIQSVDIWNDDEETRIFQEEFLKEREGDSAMNERILIAGDGSRITVSISSSILKDQDGTELGAVVLARNVEKTQKIMRQLRDAKAELEAANSRMVEQQAQLVHSEKMASVGSLSAGIAHEINNPVGFILSNLNTLNEYSASIVKLVGVYRKVTQAILAKKPLAVLEKAAKLVLREEEEVGIDFILEDMPVLMDESLEGADRVREIVKNLKSFVHQDENMEMKEANLNDCLEATLNIARNELKYKADIVKEFEDLPLLPCYPGQLNQVFLNILTNAAQAIEEKGTITLKTMSRETELVVEITDTGKGIPAEIQSKLFNPFFTTKPVGQGTGLGLSISYGIIQKHDGSISVCSEVGKGTTFQITLPKSGPPSVKRQTA